MKRIILAVLCAATVLLAADATIVGQGIQTEQRIGWGASMSQSLYVLSTKYMRDSASTRVNVDTSVASVGSSGACSQTIVIRSGTAVTPQLRCELSYRVRATDPTEDGFNIYMATRYRTPTTGDTNWAVAGRQYVYDSSQVYLTHTNPGAVAAASTRFVNFYLSGQDARVCVNRTSSGGPGTGDTIAFNNNWLRCW